LGLKDKTYIRLGSDNYYMVNKPKITKIFLVTAAIYLTLFFIISIIDSIITFLSDGFSLPNIVFLLIALLFLHDSIKFVRKTIPMKEKKLYNTYAKNKFANYIIIVILFIIFFIFKFLFQKLFFSIGTIPFYTIFLPQIIANMLTPVYGESFFILTPIIFQAVYFYYISKAILWAYRKIKKTI